jgi:ABC-2 type transport system permease protein
MKQMLSIAKKELAGYFASPLALIFLGIFLFFALFLFFWLESFFLRNVADVRPLFAQLPLLLILLCAALTMRSWSEEQRGGTLEILLTLPVKTHWLVLGKFFAALALVAIALLLTLGLPLTVSQLGPLDWGPVFGGYLASLLVASAYLAIGLAISSSTNNAVIALLATLIVTGFLYLIGSEAVAALFTHRGMELLQQIGIGSRFDSIQRGVVDLRDLIYYASLTVGFLALNTALLEAKRWSQGVRTRTRRQAVVAFTGLLALNLVLFNINIGPVAGLRVDLTENKQYSISPVTKKLLRGLQAPLTIRGYFSAKTHPKLAPLVPQIRDKLEEYASVGGKNIVVEIVDPTKDKTVEKEANEQYGIRPITLQQKDRHQAAIVNAYFHVLVKYGDKRETLKFSDLIEHRFTGGDKIEVRLRNIEYDLTRAVSKVVRSFTPLEEVFSRASETVSITHYVTKKSIPGGLDKLPGWLSEATANLKSASGNKLQVKTVDPGGEGDDALRKQLLTTFGIRPRLLWGSNAFFYLHTVVRVGKRAEALYWAGGETSKSEVQDSLVAALKRLIPGFTKTVGLLASRQKMPPMNPMMRRRPPPPRERFRFLRQQLSNNYHVKAVTLSDGRVPSTIDVLMVLSDGGIDEKQRFAIDQFLMRGGALVVCSGRFEIDPAGRRQLRVKKNGEKLAELLAHWGLKIRPELVLDEQSFGLQMRPDQNKDSGYVYWPEILDSGMAAGALPLTGVPALTMQWASPLEIVKQQGLEVKVIVSSTAKSWTSSTLDVMPDYKKHPQSGFSPPSKGSRKKHPLAVMATGKFKSFYAGKTSPLDDQDPQKMAKDKKGAKAVVLQQSGKGARVAVVGSSEFLSDDIVMLVQQMGSQDFLSGFRFAQNLVDWAVADTDLLSIRRGGALTRRLVPMTEGQRTRWEIINYVTATVGLVLVAVLAWLRRRSLRPIVIGDDARASEEEKR